MWIKRKQSVSSSGSKVLSHNPDFTFSSRHSDSRFRPIYFSYSQSVSVAVPQDKFRGSAIASAKDCGFCARERSVPGALVAFSCTDPWTMSNLYSVIPGRGTAHLDETNGGLLDAYLRVSDPALIGFQRNWGPGFSSNKTAPSSPEDVSDHAWKLSSG